jgi:hypothetical protein
MIVDDPLLNTLIWIVYAAGVGAMWVYLDGLFWLDRLGQALLWFLAIPLFIGIRLWSIIMDKEVRTSYISLYMPRFLKNWLGLS